MKFDPKQLKMGQEHEMEHTDDPKEALRVAKTHLRKHMQYYTYLKKMEREMNEKGV